MTDDIRKETRFYEAGKTIFHEGDSGSDTFVISSGKVELTKKNEDKEEVVRIVSQNGVFGEMALFDIGKRIVTAKAVENTKCIVINEQYLNEELKKSPVFIQALLRIMALNLKNHIERQNNA